MKQEVCMKKILVLACVLCLFSMSAFAQDISISAGAEVMFAMHTLGYHIDVDEDNLEYIDYNDQVAAIGVWLDFTYVRLSADFTMFVDGQVHHKLIFGGATLDDDDYDYVDGVGYNSILITLVGKYPFDVGGMIIYPEIGVAYDLMIHYDADGDGESDLGDPGLDDLSDFYIVGGVGMSVPLDPVIINLEVQFGYNLTGNSDADYDPVDEETYPGWFLGIKAGVGIAF